MPKRVHTYGHCLRRVQLLGARPDCRSCRLPPPAALARTLHLVALGDSLTAGFGLPPGQGFPEALERALRAKGYDVEVANAGVSGDTAADGLARYDWARAGGDRCADRRTRRQRHAARARSGRGQGRAGGDPDAGARRLISPRCCRHARRAQSGRRLPERGSTRSIPISPSNSASRSIRSFSTAIAADPKLNQKDGLHPTREGVEKIVANILPAVEALLNGLKG